MEVAPDLVGAFLVSRERATRLVARIVETEAYGPDDPASHSFRGPTPSNAAMFGPPGTWYVYVSYGVHRCANLVTGSVGEGSAVLLRAAEPLEGLALMRRRRGGRRDSELCSGPGKLAQAFGIASAHDGLDAVGPSGIFVSAGTAEGVVATPRIGISRGTDRPWRFVEEGTRWASRPSSRPWTARR